MLRKLLCPTKTVKGETSPSTIQEPGRLAVTFASPELGPAPTATQLHPLHSQSDQDSLLAPPQFPVSESQAS